MEKLAERMRPPSSGLPIASRINVFFFITFCLFSILILRLAMLQFVESQHLKDEEANHKNTPIPLTRGNIFDRKGAPIAYTTPTPSPHGEKGLSLCWWTRLRATIEAS
ncbi:hypothetical protein [Paenibacillus tyrfis]|uniref:hypothetical protein n=1 Tax=Paenibacillus tyrfis TaxID=1501230 RepID=UPI00117F45E5|nr:hypothetical protein [Paenibacillus tyrfis]